MKTVIIDVRTEKEFLEGSYIGAINLPSNEYDHTRFSAYRDDAIALVCNSGSRANQVKDKLEMAGFENVSLLQTQMSDIIEGTKSTSGIWTVDRQFRLALGLLIGSFLFGNYVLHSAYALLILLVVFLGLTYSAVTDNCYLKILIGIFPWNKENRVERPKPQADSVTQASFS